MNGLLERFLTPEMVPRKRSALTTSKKVREIQVEVPLLRAEALRQVVLDLPAKGSGDLNLTVRADVTLSG
jgi:hypothetical protein